jgi:hypothetical protein
MIREPNRAMAAKTRVSRMKLARERNGTFKDFVIKTVPVFRTFPGFHSPNLMTEFHKKFNIPQLSSKVIDALALRGARDNSNNVAHMDLGVKHMLMGYWVSFRNTDLRQRRNIICIIGGFLMDSTPWHLVGFILDVHTWLIVYNLNLYKLKEDSMLLLNVDIDNSWFSILQVCQ